MKHILLVDDEPEVIEGLVQILSQIDHVELHTANLASQALKLMESQPVSLVLADIRMPGMNGIEMWEAIHRRLPRCKVIFLSGVRDFDHIYRIIQNPSARFLTKMEPEEKILATVEETLAEIDREENRQEQLQSRLLYTYLTSSGEDQQQAYQQLHEHPGPLMIGKGVAFAIFSLAQAWALSLQEQREAMSSLASMVQEEARCIPSHFMRVYGVCALWILQAARGSREEACMGQMAQAICSRLDTERNQMLRCVYTAGITTLEELHEHVRFAADWLSITDIPVSQAVSLKDARTASASSSRAEVQNIKFQLQVLQGYLNLGQKENFCTLVTSLFSDTEQRGGRDTPGILQLYFGVLALLYQSLDQHSAQALRSWIRSEQIVHLQRPADREQHLRTLLEFVDAAFEHLFPADPYAHPEVIVSIQRYIQDHLDKDLSLNALSSRFSISPHYLSRLFREYTGSKLHEYITQLRLGTAERLLRTSGMKINEIAHHVGYESSHTFIRAFRRQFGGTPAEYRVAKAEQTPKKTDP